MNVNQVKGEEI